MNQRALYWAFILIVAGAVTFIAITTAHALERIANATERPTPTVCQVEVHLAITNGEGVRLVPPVAVTPPVHQFEISTGPDQELWW